MSGFQFETGPSEGTNRSAAVTDCERCHGDRFVEVEQPDLPGGGGYTAAMMRCPVCNPSHNASGGIEERRYDP